LTQVEAYDERGPRTGRLRGFRPYPFEIADCDVKGLYGWLLFVENLVVGDVAAGCAGAPPERHTCA
jgi:hypothetical protein